VLAELSGLEHVSGGVLVTPDGLVITSSLPAAFPVESLAALGATLGRELEIGAERLGRGGFRMASFTATEGTLFIGGSPLGFLILVGGRGTDVAGVRRGLGRALARLA
jgi:predicted regulator of Ras-like GTPase activity (Roadblock/LC7/MglB family)